jgi:tyrosyl-tRNA synthetase
VTFCGTYQKLNLLVWGEFHKNSGQLPQIVATVPLLEGTDGIEKMSKSKNNYIGITEPPKVMFRKTMGISDELMWRYWELLTDVSLSEIAQMKHCEPMAVKMELAGRIVADFHSAGDARQAAEDFNREVRQGAEPSDIETVALPDAARGPNGVGAKMLVSIGLADSHTMPGAKIRPARWKSNGTLDRVIPSRAATLTHLRLGKSGRSHL